MPAEGPVMLVCGPHANQFIDPIVVSKVCFVEMPPDVRIVSEYCEGSSSDGQWNSCVRAYASLSQALSHRKDIGFLSAASTMRKKYIGTMVRRLGWSIKLVVGDLEVKGVNGL